MGTIVALLLMVASVNPQKSNDVSIYVDGYIEINHRWDEDNGKLILDQILIWEWDKDKLIYRVKHWEMIKDGRQHDRETPWEHYPHFKNLLSFIDDIDTRKDIAIILSTLLANSNRQKMQLELEKKKFIEARKFAKANNMNPDNVVVWAWYDWIGSRIIKPEFNFNSEMYEVRVPAGKGNFIFKAKTFVETNTLFDPETEYKQKYDAPNGSTKLKIESFIFKK